jgi:EamA domain-containing membrane protein RarD
MNDHGIVSVIPLWLFPVANRALPLSTPGFFQYMLPTTQFILAVTFYRQCQAQIPSRALSSSGRRSASY